MFNPPFSLSGSYQVLPGGHLRTTVWSSTITSPGDFHSVFSFFTLGQASWFSLSPLSHSVCIRVLLSLSPGLGTRNAMEVVICRGDRPFQFTPQRTVHCKAISRKAKYLAGRAVPSQEGLK